MIDLYIILRINKDATQDEIKIAYKSLAQEHHPDKGGDVELFQEIQNAYSILKNKSLRSEYDETGSIDNQQIRVAAINKLGGYFQVVMQKWDGIADMIGIMKHLGNGELTALNASMIGLSVMSSNLDKLEKGFRYNGNSINIFQNIIDSDREQIKLKRKLIEKSIEKVNLAIEMLDDYDGASCFVIATNTFSNESIYFNT